MATNFALVIPSVAARRYDARLSRYLSPEQVEAVIAASRNVDVGELMSFPTSRTPIRAGSMVHRRPSAYPLRFSGREAPQRRDGYPSVRGREGRRGRCFYCERPAGKS